MNDTTSSDERDVLIKLSSPIAVNGPWLEAQALIFEEALNAEPDILGPSVTVVFAENGFEIDFQVVAPTDDDVIPAVHKVMSLAEAVMDIERIAQPSHAFASCFAPPSPKTGQHDVVLA